MKKYWFGALCLIVALASIPFALSLGWPLVQYSLVGFVAALIAFIILANVTHNYENVICTIALLGCILSFVVFIVSFIVLSILSVIHLIL